MHPPSPNNSESADSSDPYYSFQIKILPPDEARLVFEQGESQKTGNPDNQPDKLRKDSEEDELSEIPDVKFSEVTLQNRTVSPIEQFCCITRWMEIISGSNTPSLSKCQCSQQQSLEDCTVQTLDPEMAVEKCVITSDHKFDSTIEDNMSTADESLANQTMIFRWPEECTTHIEIIDLTEDDTNIEPMNVSLISIDSNQSSTSVINENQDENLFSSENIMAIQISDLEGASEQVKRKSAESSKTSSSDNIEKGIKKFFSSENEITNLMSDLGDCEQAELKSTESSRPSSSTSCDVEIEKFFSSESELCTKTSDFEVQDELTNTDAPSKPEQEPTLASVRDDTFESKHTSAESTSKGSHFVSSSSRQANINSPGPKITLKLSDKYQTAGGKRRLSGPDGFPSFPKKSGKCQFPAVPKSQPVPENTADPDSKHVATDVRSVQLALYGSASRKKQVSTGERKNLMSPTKPLSNQVPRAPETLTVSVKSLRTVPTEESSAKQRIRENWSRSYVPIIMKDRKKHVERKRKFRSLSESSLKKVDKVDSPNTEELPAIIKDRKKHLGQKKKFRSLSESSSDKKVDKVDSPNTQPFPVSSEKRNWKETPKPKQCLRRRKSISYCPKRRMEEMDDVRREQRDDCNGNYAENGNYIVLPLWENSVLRFNVLPNTFNFKDGVTDSVSDEPVEAKDKSSNIPAKKPTGKNTTLTDLHEQTLSDLNATNQISSLIS
ncbi:hypothetical protein LDENG_00194840 [Lucifuga dentata]|nr:hypothetical protein LDENG_00194840 [Lucifuga dentata]